MKQLFERVLTLMKSEGMNSREFCSRVNYGYSTFKNYESGLRTPANADFYILILKAFPNLSAEWLLRGSGPMLISEAERFENTPSAIVKDTIDRLEKEVRELNREVGRLEQQLASAQAGKKLYDMPDAADSIAAEQ